VNTSVTSIDFGHNPIGDEGASALADALKVNTFVTSIRLGNNEIGDESASALADALMVNTFVTMIDLYGNKIGDEGALALADALKVNTSVTSIYLYNDSIDKSNLANVDALVARNKRLRCLFIFDARKMLLSLMCADECGVVWPYLLDKGDKDGAVAPDNIETIRTEFGVVVAERRCRLQNDAGYEASSF
jgi:hypothetical protein